MSSAVPLPPAIEAGAIVAARYRIERVLDSGGQGVVVLATQLVTEQKVAIKFMLGAGLDAESVAAKRFAREARAAAKLRGNHAVRVLDVAKLPSGEPYIVLEYLEGADLEHVAQRSSALSVGDAVDYVMQALEALAEAHAAGIVHRDIKPQNLFLTRGPDGSPFIKVLDFGLSKLDDARFDALTKTQTILGSPRYMSPEQINDPRDVDARTDIWATGGTLFRLLEQRHPFDAGDIPAIVRRVLAEAPAPFTREDVPEELREIILQCLEKRPEDRPRNVHELAQALTPFAPPGSAARVERIRRMVADTASHASGADGPGARAGLGEAGFDDTVAASAGGGNGDPFRTEVAPLRDRFPEASRSADVPRVGEVIAGKYRVEEFLGEGGMGIVVAARHLQLGERVAIKMLRKKGMRDDRAVTRFVREARTAARVKSEHVARVIDVATLENGAPYIVMEHLDGVDLARVLAERGPLPIDEAVDFVLQAAVGIAEAHVLGVVHRDLKPSNLFRTTRTNGAPILKVLDFGVSKDSADSEASPALTETGALFGSPGYMSPEQIRSAKRVDARTDIWALGVILYELLTGVGPFVAEGAAGLLAAITADSPRPMRDLRPDIPDELERVVLRCLEKDRELRFPTVAELAAALSPFAPASGRPSLARIARASAPPASSSSSPSSSPSSVDSMSSYGSTERAWTDATRKGPSARGVGRRRGRVTIATGVLLAASAIVGTVLVRNRNVTAPAPGAAPPLATPIDSPAQTPPPSAVSAAPSQAAKPVTMAPVSSTKPRVRQPSRPAPISAPSASAPPAATTGAPIDPTSGRGD